MNAPQPSKFNSPRDLAQFFENQMQGCGELTRVQCLMELFQTTWDQSQAAKLTTFRISSDANNINVQVAKAQFDVTYPPVETLPASSKNDVP